jgi:tripartite-type tricarboxylate transporter receptor subunit TctC
VRRRAILAGVLAAPAARAQPRPVTLVAPFTPGAPPDLVARLIAEPLQRRWGTPVVVENRAGASGTIGAEQVSRAAPDGLTLMIHTMTLSIAPSLYKALRFDPVASFTPVSLLVETAYALCVHAATFADVPALIAAAKAQPGAVNYSSPGVGTPHHLTMELFRRQAGIELTHVPYRGSAGAVGDLIGGQVAAMFMPIGAAIELGKDGRVRVLGVTADTRLAAAPAVPTIAELGVAGVTMRDWFAIFAPAGLPAETLARINESVMAVLAEPAVATALSGQALTIVGGPPERLRDRLATDLPRWTKVVQAAGITPD